MNTSVIPSVADYFEQALGSKLLNPFTGEALDKYPTWSPAHPDFNIHSGCGIDCRAVIDAAAAVLVFLRSDTETPENVSAALVGAAALIRFARDCPEHESKAEAALELIRSASDAAREPAVLDVTRIAAEIVNVYVYG